jgi:hypothetical protein
MNRRGFFATLAAAAATLAAPKLFPARLAYEAPTLTSLGVMSPAGIARIQQLTLARVYRDSLYPRLLFQMETAVGLFEDAA